MKHKDDTQINRPIKRTIRNLLRKYKKTGSIGDKVSRVHHRDIHSAETIADTNFN